MRLTADVVLSAPSRISPTEDRELDLRGLKAPAIENLGLTGDAYDAIDLSDNEFARLENIPRLARLRMLLLNNNAISRVEAGIASSLPILETLVLTNNRIGSFVELDTLCGIRSLQLLSLLGNPVTRKANYRLFVISRLPHLHSLDFVRITDKERTEAARFAASKKGKAFAAEIAAARAAGTAGPAALAGGAAASGVAAAGSGAADGAGAAPLPGVSPEDALRLAAAIEAATSTAEVEELERAIRDGRVRELLDERERRAEAAEAALPSSGPLLPTPAGAAASGPLLPTPAPSAVAGGGGGRSVDAPPPLDNDEMET